MSTAFSDNRKDLTEKMENPDKQLQVETINTYVQLVSDDAHSVLLYGSIAVGIIVFSLPTLLDFTIKSTWYWVFLFLGSIGLLLGSGIFFWYSRRLTMMNFKFGVLLFDMTANPSFTVTDFRNRVSEIPIFKKGYVKNLIKTAKISGGFGALFYFIAIIFFLSNKLANL